MLRPPGDTSTRETLWVVAGIASAFGGIIATAHLWYGRRPWLAVIPIVVAAAALWFCIWRGGIATAERHERNSRRFGQLEDEGALSGEFEIRRAPVRKWPAVITLLCAAPVVIFFAVGASPLAKSFLLFAAVVSLAAWLVAALLGKGVIATITPTGLIVRREEIPWSNIAGLDLQFLPRVETAQIVIRLERPRTPQTAGERLNSALSGGHSDREIVVSLARAEEPSSVIFELVLTRWERSVGEQRALDALIESVRELERLQRPWRTFSPAEKRRSLLAGGSVFAAIGFAVHGVFTPFRASDDWFLASLVISVLLTIAGSVALVRKRAFISLRNGQGTPSYIALFVLMSSLFVGVAWATIGWSWADLATRAVGRETTREVRFDKQYRPDRKRCRDPLALYLDAGRPYRFCATPALRNTLPADGTVRLQLRESWFGVHIVRVSTIGD